MKLPTVPLSLLFGVALLPGCDTRSCPDVDHPEAWVTFIDVEGTCDEVLSANGAELCLRDGTLNDEPLQVAFDAETGRAEGYAVFNDRVTASFEGYLPVDVPIDVQMDECGVVPVELEIELVPDPDWDASQSD